MGSIAVDGERKTTPTPPPTPAFLVSVAAKGVSHAVSLLFATVAGESISVATKGLTQANCGREGNFVRSSDFEGV
jgi:hypothetical protein